ncbi:MAG: HTTM domain-containing protein [Chloroflexi bacterium]|nr:HTTM domain-containing protein [Chloroflexota bacterium]
MRGALSRIDRFWYRPAPATRLAALRIIIGGFALGYVVIRGPHLMGYADFDASQFEPTGVTSVLSGTLSDDVLGALVMITILAGVAFVTGAGYRVTGPIFAMLLLFVTGYRNSFGQIFHTENLMVIHVMVLALAPAADSVSLDAWRRGETRTLEPDGRYGWAIQLMCLLTVLTYFISGQTKLRNAGLEWVTTDTLRNFVAYDNLRKAELGDSYSFIGAALVAHGWLFKPLAAFTLAAELGAPLAMLGGRVAKLWALSAWLFHVGILAVMAILFPYPLAGVAFAPFFPVEQLWRPFKRLVQYRPEIRPIRVPSLRGKG